MNIQRVKGVLLAITASMVAGLVLIPQVAFSQGFSPIPITGQVHLEIDTVDNSCTFVTADGQDTIEVTSPDRLKVVQKGKNDPEATCKDDYLKTNGERMVLEVRFGEQGSPFGVFCDIRLTQTFGWRGSFKQKIDKNGTTLTCEGSLPIQY